MIESYAIRYWYVYKSIQPTVNIRKFWPARRIPFAFEKKVELELNRIEQTGLIEKNDDDISEHASPIDEFNDAIRKCGGFRVKR